jgi:hypothetical protein
MSASELLSPEDFAQSEPCAICGASAGSRCIQSNWTRAGNGGTKTRLETHFGRAGYPRARGYGLVIVAASNKDRPATIQTYRIPGPGKAVA